MGEYDEIKAKLEKKHNVPAGEKADTLYRLAWEYGHSSGENEITYHYEEMLPLIQ